MRTAAPTRKTAVPAVKKTTAPVQRNTTVPAVRKTTSVATFKEVTQGKPTAAAQKTDLNESVGPSQSR